MLLKDIEENLPCENFMRIHKSFRVNIDKVISIKHDQSGRYKIYLNDEDDTALPISKKINEKIKARLSLM